MVAALSTQKPTVAEADLKLQKKIYPRIWSRRFLEMMINKRKKELLSTTALLRAYKFIFSVSICMSMSFCSFFYCKNNSCLCLFFHVIILFKN